MLASLPEDHSAEVWLPNDLEHGAHPLCVELARLGHRAEHVDLPILRRSYATPRGMLRLAARCWPLWRRLRRVRPHAVYCATSAAFLAAPVARVAGVGRVAGHVQEMWGRVETIVLTAPALCCGRLVAISEAVAHTLPTTLRHRTVVVPNPTPDPGAVTVLADTGAVRFLVASRWTRAKGIETLMAAWAQLLARLPEEVDVPQLVVLGGRPPIGEGVDVRREVARLDDPSSVRVLGEVPDIGAELASASVVLMPSARPEPFGLVAIEAFARARPVVASRAGGLLEIVEEGETGWFFTPGDVDDLARVLLEIAALAPDELRRRGALARADYESRFLPERFVAAWRAAVL